MSCSNTATHAAEGPNAPSGRADHGATIFPCVRTQVSDAQLAELHIAKAGKALTREADAAAAAAAAAAALKKSGGMAGAFKSKMR